MNTFDYLSNSQLVRAINTTKNYVVIDTRYSCNHSVGKVTFSDNYPKLSDEVFGIDLACMQDGLHAACYNLYQGIQKHWGFYCYHYESFEAYLRQAYSISEWQFKTLKRFVEA